MDDAADEDHTQEDGLFVEPDFIFDSYFDDNECNATERGGAVASSQGDSQDAPVEGTAG
jgi:hypothetical protein